ncbi:hypothetical protein [Microvirga makkahensis]|uniref:4-amino-4-deoxy-L-arabinose transferase n=1 Tax=Microvirga makkahensis TaxID=1128670 RepID=A0A7X3MQQ9_9HYPH|nr:hypothetical protein [Microvirga makkahensis]MXQ11452.1 hypothetical protein [Microvirga makkahensis]
MSAQANGMRFSAGAILVGATLFACLLAGPGLTVTASYVNDLFIFLDGAHRIDWGQIPNRDFHTALGPLSFYIPALGYWISGTMGGAMPYGMALVTLFLAPPIAHVIGSRLQPVIGIPYGLFLLLVLAVPANLGESVTALSFAMFYNRIGWAALGALLIMYLRPIRPMRWQNALDAFSATVLIVVMLYTKITYGLVALAFLAFLLLDARQRGWAAAAFGLTLLCGLVIEAFWQSTSAYFDDLALTGRVSGSRGIVDLASALLRHLADFSLLAIFALLVLWRTRSLPDLLFFGFCTLPGLMIQSQNSQPWGILTIHAGAAAAAQMLLHLPAHPPGRGAKLAVFGSGSPLLLMALILPTLLHCAMALGFHTTLALAKAGQAFDLPRFGEIRLISPWLSRERTMMHAYLASIEEGARGLKSLPEKPVKVSVLDFSNPFSAGLDLPPPRGDSAWLHWGRNINEVHFTHPGKLLADVEILMLPTWGINNIPLRTLYQTHIDSAFELLLENEGWAIYRRKNPEVAAKDAPSGNAGPYSWLRLGDGFRP